LKCAARGSLKTLHAKKSPSVQHRTNLSGYVLPAKSCIDNQKKTC